MLSSETGRDAEAGQILSLVEAVHRQYGFDFREYAYASLRRRILARVEAEDAPGVPALQGMVLRDDACMERLLLGLTVHSTSMFRDPGFYRALREKVVPYLKTYPFVRIWIAGCSTGEEVYSTAILLVEEGLHGRCRIYATDLSEAVLRRARSGVFPLASMKEYTVNYLQAGGRRSFSEYYTAAHDGAIFHPALKDTAIFAQHDLASDASFNEFNVVLCRNVMIYFNQRLQERVHRLIYESLARLGVLGLGCKESIKFTPHSRCYETLDAPERLYRKVR